MKTIIQFSLVALVLISASLTNADSKLIHAGQLLPIAGKNVLTEQSIYIEKGKIVSVSARL